MPDEKKSWIKDAIRTYIVEVLSFHAEQFKRKVRKYAILIIVAIASLTVMIYGAGSLIGSFFPEWRAGISHIISGAFIIFALWIYRKGEK